MNIEREVRLFGRRFVLSTRATHLIAGLSLVAFIVVIIRPEAAPHIAVILAAATAGITGAATVFTHGESAVDLKHGKKEIAADTMKTQTTTETTVHRTSGIVPDPIAGRDPILGVEATP